MLHNINSAGITEFNLEKITRFNKRLITDFTTEYVDDRAPSDGLIHKFDQSGQFKDIYNAYLYAQDEILPSLQTNLLVATAEQFIEMLHAIHFRIAQTLTRNSPELAGQFAPSQIYRWMFDVSSSDISARYCLKRIKKEAAIAQLVEKYGVDPDRMRAVLNLFDRIRDDRRELNFFAVDRAEVEAMGLDFTTTQAALIQSKLAHYYFNDLLTPDEKVTLTYFLKFSLPPERIQAVMQAFAQECLRKWQTCDPNNDGQVVELLAFAYRGLTSIHPYVNGNGRTATCLINIIPVSMGRQSILLRSSTDRIDANSHYNYVMNNMDSNIQLLSDYLLERMHAPTVEDNNEREKYVVDAIESTNMIHRIMRDFPNTNLKTSLAVAVKTCESEARKKGIVLIDKDAQSNAFRMANLRSFFTNFYFLQHKLQARRAAVSAVVVAQFTEEQKQQLANALVLLTGQQEWYFTETAAIASFADNTSLLQVLDRLHGIKAVTIEIQDNAQTKLPVLKLSQVNVSALVSLCEGLTQTAAAEIEIQQLAR